MDTGKIVAVYVGLIRPPRRFVIHRKLSADREVFEVYKPRTLHDFISQLLTVLSPTRPDFMARVATLDDIQFQKSKHKTRRYVAEHRDVLYIDSEHLTEKNSERVLGYWVATNIGRKEASAIAGLACEAAGVSRESISRLQL
jgi:hypothetical protein